MDDHYGWSRILPLTVLRSVPVPFAWTWALLTSQFTDGHVVRLCLQDLAEVIELNYSVLWKRLNALGGHDYKTHKPDGSPVLAEMQGRGTFVEIRLRSTPDGEYFTPREWKKHTPVFFLPDFLFLSACNLRLDSRILWGVLQDQFFTLSKPDLRKWCGTLSLSRYRRRKATKDLLAAGYLRETDGGFRVVRPEEHQATHLPLCTIDKPEKWELKARDFLYSSGVRKDKHGWR